MGIEEDLEEVVMDYHKRVEKEAQEFEEELNITEEERIALEMSQAAEKELERIMKELQSESQQKMDEKLEMKEDEHKVFETRYDNGEEGFEAAVGQNQQDDDPTESKMDATTMPSDLAHEDHAINASRIVANTNGASEKSYSKTHNNVVRTTQAQAPVSEFERAMQRRRQQVDTQGAHFESKASSARVAHFSWHTTAEK